LTIFYRVDQYSDSLGDFAMENYAIHWFRRDLRISGNMALAQSWKDFDGKVLGFFCFDKKFLSRSDFSINRFQLFLNRLKELKLELQASGGDLLVLDVDPEEAFQELFKSLDHLPKLITFNRDYEPFARERDQNLTVLFQQFGIEVKTYRDHLIIEPHELSKDGKNDEGYQVFTPFSRKWNRLMELKDFAQRIRLQKQGLTLLKEQSQNNFRPLFNLTWKNLFKDKKTLPEDSLETYILKNHQKVSIEIPDVSAKSLYRSLESFKNKIEDYRHARDIPSLLGTSRFSLYLKNGSLTTSQIIQFLNLSPYEKAITSSQKFLSEIIWREFYYHILFRHPRIENESFNTKYRDIKWENDTFLFEAWKNGMTGFPIVDAGMRELKQTGWMHNRVRMIVASFLTKDLLIDWKWGEAYFMETLLDGDLAPNNGGWQWAASTGCDPQPYFRIFNPWSQSLKFDPEGSYIKKYIPELKDVPAKNLHEPLTVKNYPRPIVDHSMQRLKALKLYNAKN